MIWWQLGMEQKPAYTGVHQDRVWEPLLYSTMSQLHWGLFNKREDGPLLAHQHHFVLQILPSIFPSKYL